MTTRRTVRLVSWLVPHDWRATVVHDLQDEARAARSHPLWLAGALVAVGLRMRLSFGTDAARVDVRAVVRSMWPEKGFTASAVFTLALGIGVNLAVFTIVDPVLFRPLPFTHIHPLVI